MAEGSLFLQDLYFQKIKVNAFYEIVLIKTSLLMTLKVLNVGIQPYGLAQIPGIAKILQGAEDLVGSGILHVLTYRHIFYHMVILHELSPQSKHALSSLLSKESLLTPQLLFPSAAFVLS